MNKTNAVLVAIIVVLAASFAWYAARHPVPAQAPSETSVPAAATGTAPLPAGPRSLQADLDTAGVAKLRLEVGVGEVHVTPSPDDKLHVVVTLRQKEREFMWFFHWMSQGSSRSIAGAKLKQERQGDRLDLSLDYPRAEDQDDVKQEWEVQAPARLALDADMKVGELTIKGLAGGVTARLDVGELSVDAPKGAIEGTVNVGEIRAKSGSNAHGKISLSSTIGEAVLYINGEQSGYHEHGGLGNSVRVDGAGPDTMNLSVNVGEASLRITPADGSKDHA